MNIKILFLLLTIMMMFTTAVLGQAEKREVEDSIDRSEMPEKALVTLDSFWPDLEGIRYFAETDGDTETYEAKLEWDGKQFSIEFTGRGYIIDVEQLVTREEISSEVNGNIDRYLSTEFTRIRITRLQRQFIADDDDEVDNIDFIHDILESDEEDYEVRYELEVEGKSGSAIGAFELLFDHYGELIQRRKIVRRSLDNIW